MAAVELVADRATRARFEPGLKVNARIVRAAQQTDLIVRPRGDIVTLAPPFVVSEEQIEEIVAILRHSIEATLETVR
jgi:L-2,4-diaminobutyrate transaminase